MAVFNYEKKEIDAKIVYYGPAISGKTTNLQFIYQHLKPDQRGKMISLATKEDRTLFFDFLPIELASVRGFKTRFHLYTVPGQVYYGTTRRAVLTGADGVVFVADSHGERMEDNLASFRDLEANLRNYGKKMEAIPLVIQYNKRDLPGVLSVDVLNQEINRFGSPYFESVAILGKGVFESLTMVCQLVLEAIENGVECRRSVSTPEKAAPSPPPNPKVQAERTATSPGPSPSRREGIHLPSPGRRLQVEEPLAPPEATPPCMERTLGKAAPEMKEAIPFRPGHPAQAVLHTARLRDLREDKKAPIGHRTGLGKGVPPVDGPAFGKLTSPGVEDLKEERKPSNPELPDQPSENRKQELSIKLDKTAGKKIPLIKERVRILSSGQPRVSSPKTLEIPLNLAVETAEKSVPLNINLLIKLEQIDPDPPINGFREFSKNRSGA
jgi:signal recognition particle receptor subunit beta